MSNIVVLAPELGITPQEFADAWNADANHPAIARVVENRESDFYCDPLIITAVVHLIGVTGEAVMSWAVIELIKSNFLKESEDRKNIQAIETKLPNGSTVIDVVLEKE